MDLQASTPATSDAPIIEPRPAARTRMSEEEIARLGDAIAELSARIQAAAYELLVLIRQFDERACWNDGGCLSCAHWLSWRIGLDPGVAREKVRVARALAKLPQISAAMERGELSYSKVRALTRIATPENERRLLAPRRAARRRTWSGWSAPGGAPIGWTKRGRPRAAISSDISRPGWTRTGCS